jgi:putative FmdB family regulatory protein
VPTYQYQCSDCGEALEVHQSFSDDALTVCPECEGRLRKVFNAVGVVFKGSGFYRNDSRGTSSTSDAGSSTSKDSSSGATKRDSGSSASSTAASSSTKGSGSAA